MADYLILTDTCCDFPLFMSNRKDFEAAPLSVTIGGQTYQHHLDERELKIKDFYRMLRNKESVLTAAPSLMEFRDRALPYLQKGMDVLFLGLSSNVSATYANACMALRDLKAEFPNRVIEAVDTLSGSMGQGFLVDLALKMRDQGASLFETAEKIKQLSTKVLHYFTVNDLYHLRRGGRIQAHTAFVGSVLQFKPILSVTKAGRLISISKARGMKNALRYIAELFVSRSLDPDKQTVYITHADCEEKAMELSALFKQAGAGNTCVSLLGPVLGAHAGPDAIACFFTGKEREYE